MSISVAEASPAGDGGFYGLRFGKLLDLVAEITEQFEQFVGAAVDVANDVEWAG